MMNRMAPSKCLLAKTQAECSAPCKWQNNKCYAEVEFQSPIKYGDVSGNPDTIIHVPSVYEKDKYLDTCPIENDYNIEKSNINPVNNNSCQIYWTDKDNVKKIDINSMKTSNTDFIASRNNDVSSKLLSATNKDSLKFQVGGNLNVQLYAMLHNGDLITYLKNGSTNIPVKIRSTGSEFYIICILPGVNMLKYLKDGGTWSSTKEKNTKVVKKDFDFSWFFTSKFL